MRASDLDPDTVYAEDHGHPVGHRALVVLDTDTWFREVPRFTGRDAVTHRPGERHRTGQMTVPGDYGWLVLAAPQPWDRHHGHPDYEDEEHRAALLAAAAAVDVELVKSGGMAYLVSLELPVWIVVDTVVAVRVRDTFAAAGTSLS